MEIVVVFFFTLPPARDAELCPCTLQMKKINSTSSLLNLQGKDVNTRNKLLESDIILYIGKHEMELNMKVNCAAYDGDYYLVKRLIGAGADPNNTDYDGRSPLV